MIKSVDLGPHDRWKYLNEGLNHVIFKYNTTDSDNR